LGIATIIINYTESLVANMYFIGLIMIVYALLIVPLQNLLPKYSTYFIAAFFAFEIIYRGLHIINLSIKEVSGIL